MRSILLALLAAAGCGGVAHAKQIGQTITLEGNSGPRLVFDPNGGAHFEYDGDKPDNGHAIIVPHTALSEASEIPENAVGFDTDTGWIFKIKELPQTQIYRGTRSVDGEFPVHGWIGNCTATLVAPNVVFTASHCVTTGKRITFKHRGSGGSYAATCTRHPDYNTRTVFNDYALCKLDNPVPASSVLCSFTKTKPAVGAKLLMEGYGAPNVGTHYWGESSVKRYDGQDLVSCGPSTLGGGDSGGALLKWNPDRSQATGCEIYAVNSRGNNQCDWYNEVTHPNAQAFFASYERSNGVQLCGVGKVCGPEDPQPINCEELYDELGACIIRPDGSEPMPARTCRESYTAFAPCLFGK
jgi:trypsin